MPHLPSLHRVVPLRAQQRRPSAALLGAWASGAPRPALDRPPYAPGDLGDRLAPQPLPLCKRLRRLPPIVTETLAALGTAVRQQTPKTGVDIARLAFPPGACVGTGVREDLGPVLAGETPARERRAHHVLGPIPRQAFRPRRPSARW